MKNLLKISAILITLMLIVSSCGKGTSKEERSEKIKTESSIYDVDYKDIVTVCEALDATIALFEELFALLEATDSDMGASELQKQENLTWMAKYYSFNMRFKELRLSDSFTKESKDCSNYYIYKSLKDKTSSEQISSKMDLYKFD